MRTSFATEVPVDETVTELPLAVRQRIGAIVAQGGTIHGVERIDADTYVIHRTLPETAYEVTFS